MDTLVAQLTAPPRSRDNDEEGIEGYGNLDRFGAVDGMTVPGVPDVSCAGLPSA